MANIKQLPNDVIQLIAAGEVIDSLAAVVRELAENAIDAGATRINIDIQPQRWQIRVVDNGQGMDLEDLQQCALPHRTSKIGDRQDLAHIKSLGFRGKPSTALLRWRNLPSPVVKMDNPVINSQCSKIMFRNHSSSQWPWERW